MLAAGPGAPWGSGGAARPPPPQQQPPAGQPPRPAGPGALGQRFAAQGAQQQPAKPIFPRPPAPPPKPRASAPQPQPQPQQQPQTRPPANSGPAVFDVNAQDFQAKVLQASHAVPILLDLWAPWCGPCRQLTPVLESAVSATGGRVKLAKLNTDANPDLAQALKVSSLPTVLAVFQGKVVDQFVGLQSAQKVSELVARLVALGASAGGAADANSLETVSGDVALAVRALADAPEAEEMVSLGWACADPG
jgi:thioredoxin